MPKRSRKEKGDPNQSAFDVIKRVMVNDKNQGKNPLAVALGRRGGLKGGKARAAKLSEAERRESASNAAKARWAKRKRP
jgi:hypothetical protein